MVTYNMVNLIIFSQIQDCMSRKIASIVFCRNNLPVCRFDSALVMEYGTFVQQQCRKAHNIITMNMKRIYLMLMMLASVSIIAAAEGQDSTARYSGPRPPHGRPEMLRHVSPEKKAEAKADRMQKTVDLSDKQYKKVYRLFLKTEKAKSEDMSQRPPMGGPGGMRPPMGGPEGMRPPMGGGPGMGHGPGGRPDMLAQHGSTGMREDRPSPDGKDTLQMPELPSEEQIEAMQKEDRKLRKILSESQYEKWQRISAEKPGKPGKAERAGKPDRHEPDAPATN